MEQSDLAASRRLLRVRRKRASRRGAADQRDELACRIPVPKLRRQYCIR